MGLFDFSFLPWNDSKKVRETNSFIDNVFRDKVKPKLGSVVHCDLSAIPSPFLTLPPIPYLDKFKLEHSGIYIGDGMIAHRDGDGYLDRVTPSEFLDRLNGKNCAISVYVSCIGDRPLHSMAAFNRARAALNNSKFDGYDLLSKNCHNFTRYCLTGDFDDDQDDEDFTFKSLEELLYYEFDVDNWRVWDYDN